MLMAENADVVAFGDRLVDKSGGGFPEARVGEEIPDGRVGVGYRNDHQKSERGKFANTSARFWSISSADGETRASVPFGQPSPAHRQ
jgi:hypothetical protein